MLLERGGVVCCQELQVRSGLRVGAIGNGSAGKRLAYAIVGWVCHARGGGSTLGHESTLACTDAAHRSCRLASLLSLSSLLRSECALSSTWEGETMPRRGSASRESCMAVPFTCWLTRQRHKWQAGGRHGEERAAVHP